MISFAQNQEDVVLSRLLSIVPNGRFVDVGAGHPVIENVTYWLYLQGWRGTNVEPMRYEAELLRETRPGDTTLQAAVGAEAGTMTLYEAPMECRGNTTSDLSLVHRYLEAGLQFEACEVEVVTLDRILSTFAPGSVHVLKVDVEGDEGVVLAGAALERHRPWVVVVEATRPDTRIDSSSSWAPLLAAAGFVCVLFDGLNRFYVRHDLSDVVSLLSVPANVFDAWKPSRLADLEEEMARVVQAAAQQSAADEERFRECERYARHLEQAAAADEERFRECERYARHLEQAAAADEERFRECERYARHLEAELRRERGDGPPRLT